MGKIIKFLLSAILFLFLLGMIMGLMEQFGGVLLAIVAVGAVAAVVAKKSSNKPTQSNLETTQEPLKPLNIPAPEPVKKAVDDKMEKLHVDMED